MFFIANDFWYDLELQLPKNLTCDRCVLQWRYHGGNNWGCDGPGDCGIGKGPQEEFVNCADITIVDEMVAPSTTSTTQTTTHGAPVRHPHLFSGF